MIKYIYYCDLCNLKFLPIGKEDEDSTTIRIEIRYPVFNTDITDVCPECTSDIVKKYENVLRLRGEK
jgi:hypothetical protein